MKNFKDKIVVITGAASGIGWALAERLTKEGAQLVLSDLNEQALVEKAKILSAIAIPANVGVEADIKYLVDQTILHYGRIDLFVSNAGIAYPAGIDIAIDKWKQIYDINVLSQVYAAKYVLPIMLAQGSGYLLNTASAAGLLTEFNSAPYTVTKHASVALSEWLALNYKNKGIQVSVLCPAAVKTPMIANSPSLEKYAIEVEEVIDKVIEALAENRFMISTHAYIDQLFRLKGNNYEEYLQTMEKYRKETEELDQHRQS